MDADRLPQPVPQVYPRGHMNDSPLPSLAADRALIAHAAAIPRLRAHNVGQKGCSIASPTFNQCEPP